MQGQCSVRVREQSRITAGEHLDLPGLRLHDGVIRHALSDKTAHNLTSMLGVGQKFDGPCCSQCDCIVGSSRAVDGRQGK